MDDFLKKANKVHWGLVTGIVSPGFGFLLYYLLMFHHKSLVDFIEMVKIQKQIQSPLLSLCLITNLAFFMIGLRVNMYYFARGIIMAMFIYVPVVVYLKFYY